MSGRAPSAVSRPVAGTPHPAARSVVLAVLLALALLGCTTPAPVGDDPVVAQPVGAAATSTRGAELRAALTWMLTERVHLLLSHTRALAAAQGQRSTPAVVAARRAIDESADATVDVLAGSYSGARAQLLPALRAHDAALVARVASVTGSVTAPGTGSVTASTEASVTAPVDDEAASGAAEETSAADDEPSAAELDEARDRLVVAVRRVVPGLRSQDVDAALALHAASLEEAALALAEGSPRAPGLQRTAHEAAWALARLLAVGVSSDRGLGLAGSPATELRGRLTGLLTEHVLLSGALADRLREADGDAADPAVQAVDTALDAAAVALAELVGRSAPESALSVLGAWRGHQDDLRSLAVARSTGASPPPAGADGLVLLQQALAPNAQALPLRAGELGQQAAASLRAAVDAAATGSPDAPAALRAAAADTVAPAALLAAALAEQFALS